jgi:hypothetical protein
MKKEEKLTTIEIIKTEAIKIELILEEKKICGWHIQNKWKWN